MEHLESQLAAADVVLDETLLDRIDEILPPGTTINPADNSWVKAGATGATAIGPQPRLVGRPWSAWPVRGHT